MTDYINRDCMLSG